MSQQCRRLIYGKKCCEFFCINSHGVPERVENDDEEEREASANKYEKIYPKKNKLYKHSETPLIETPLIETPKSTNESSVNYGNEFMDGLYTMNTMVRKFKQGIIDFIKPKN